MMTKQEIIRLVERNMSNNPNPMIATEAGVRAVKKCAPLAKKHKIEFALAGGIAMHFYGSPRLTKDVDVFASRILPIEAERQLERLRVAYMVGDCIDGADWVRWGDESIF